MAQPQWITPAGSLGTVAEGIFYQQAMLATVDPLISGVVCTATNGVTNRITCNSTQGIYTGLNVMFAGTVFGGISSFVRYFVLAVHSATEFSLTEREFTTTPIQLSTSTGSMTAEFSQHILFTIQAGSLPAGIQISDNGLIIGTPKAVASIQGVPFEVNRDVTSKFTVRAYTTNFINGQYVLDKIRDRTFTLTVTGPNPPQFITPAGQIAQYYDGSLVNFQINYTDTDPNDLPTVKLVGGNFPTGLTVNSQGLISGYITPLSPINETAGFSRDGQGYDKFSFDFSTMSVNSNYEFTLELTDGVYSELRTFSIYVYSKNSLTADTTDITADNTFVTADVTPTRPPIITNPEGNIGTVRSDNWFAYRFNGLDLDGDQIDYEIIYNAGDSAGIPGLTLDQNSGWLYGYIPNLGVTELTYNFNVRISKDLDPLVYNEYSYSLDIVGAIDTDIVWLVPSDLGTIVNGATSTLYVAAESVAGIPLQYELLSGSNSSLPQGLQLLPSGEIAGRVSFNTFALDLGTTTFDVTMNDLGITGKDTETTFDMKHSFVVRVFSVNGLISITKTFSITVKRVYNEPYDNLYIEAMPPVEDRALIDNLLQNADIFRPDLLYRPSDPNFSRASGVVYNHAFGLTATTYADYVSSLYENHYWKTLTLGEIKVAQARNGADEVIYEVVYSQVIDNLLNTQGQSVSKQVTLPYPINENDSTEISTVYPNSLINMRDQVIDTVGEVDDVLPLWMTSKQANGKVLGFTPAWVLAYAKPGKGDQIAYYIKTKFGERLNLIDFEVDRYELDRLLSKNWDPVADSTYGAWVPTPAETTFDIYEGYQYDTPSLDTTGQVLTSTTDYGNGSKTDFAVTLMKNTGKIAVTLNGVLQTYNSNFTVNYGRLPNYVRFTTPPASGDVVIIYQIEDLSITDDNGPYSSGPTTFDNSSIRFIAPVDMYSNTQEYDKYLVFPKRTILG
jgi:hypothetical protein